MAAKQLQTEPLERTGSAQGNAMNERSSGNRRVPSSEGMMQYLWKRKAWWLLPLCVLFLLLGIIYALAHFSRTDSEMYPTTMRESEVARRIC